MPRFVINPVNTGNQPLLVDVTFDGNRVASAKVGLMGLWSCDLLLTNKHPFDALQIVLRLNSHWSVSHGIAAARAIESAGALPLSFNGLLARNVLLACEYIYYHLYHFYQGVLFTFTSGPKGEALLLQDRIPAALNARLVENYWQAISIRTRLQELMAILSGKVPHNGAIVPGGTSESIDAGKLVKISSHLKQVRLFLQEKYIKDIEMLIQFYPEWSKGVLGGGNYLSAADFPQKLLEDGREVNYQLGASILKQGVLQQASLKKVTLDRTCSWVLEDGSYDINKSGAYSWIAGGQYDGTMAETGSLARNKINGSRSFTEQVTTESVLGREMVKAWEALELSEQIMDWLDLMEPGQPMKAGELVVPQEGSAVGIAESPAGPLLHKVIYEKGVIKEYSIVDPIAFNLAPHDKNGVPGPFEQAMLGLVVNDPLHPLEIVRVLRSFE